MNGILNIFKPRGITSHDVVNVARKILGMRRIGHTGTLDPNVSGVLPLCIGKATRISEYLLDADKEYVGSMCLGLATDTQDKWGKVINKSTKKVSISDITEAFNEFRGSIEQTPPMYSAIKYKGKKLYEIAREGRSVARKSRHVDIYDLEILHIENNKKLIFYTKCSKGTYIRTLCDSIGNTLGTYGYMDYLIRVGVGGFKISDSYSLENIASLDKQSLETIISPMDRALNCLDAMFMDNKFYKHLINGAIVYVQNDNLKKHARKVPLKVYCNDKFIGIGQILEEDGRPYLKMVKVLV